MFYLCPQGATVGLWCWNDVLCKSLWAFPYIMMQNPKPKETHFEFEVGAKVHSYITTFSAIQSVLFHDDYSFGDIAVAGYFALKVTACKSIYFNGTSNWLVKKSLNMTTGSVNNEKTVLMSLETADVSVLKHKAVITSKTEPIPVALVLTPEVIYQFHKTW